jgi:D-3-phosphoglycerate dehydrogenase
MRVIGYDPHITVTNAWQLASQVEKVLSVDDVLAQSDFVSLHVPLTDSTRGLIDAKRLRISRPGITLLNFSRQGIIDHEAVYEAINAEKMKAYVCDFPDNLLKSHPRVIPLPHLGASTEEAEENCAVMVADQIRDYLEHGTIRNSVNFPEMTMPRSSDGYRLLVVNSNVPHMIERISKAIANADINILDLLNRSRGEIACTLVDMELPLPQSAIDEIGAIEGVLRVRAL